MKITKFGHSCLLVEDGRARILLDPGSYSTVPKDLKAINAILITHEHQDHLNFDTLKIILKNNPKAKIFTNHGVGKKLVEQNISYDVLGSGQSITVNSVLIEGFGEKHAMIHPDLPSIDNTGYRIAKRFFYGGDSVENSVDCEILAYPAVAPWMKVEWALDYAIKIKPKLAFPVHDAFLKFPGPFYMLPEKFLTEAGIKWLILEEGKAVEL